MIKSVRVKRHKRSAPQNPPFEGPGKKPGPKNVNVKSHKRSKPKK